MFKFLINKKGQSTLEYAILVVIIIGALLTIQIYMKRGLQARMRQTTDQISNDEQFDPWRTNYNKKTVTNVTTEDTFKSGVTKSSIVGNEDITINVLQNITGSDRNATSW